MTEWTLKYGLNPTQGSAHARFLDVEPWLQVLNGRVGYINLLDAIKAWALARELAQTLLTPAAVSIKHVHPAGAAMARSLDAPFRIANRLGDSDLSPIATAYARARGGDRISSFGDFIGLSERVDETCARLIAKEVSDGIIAPEYSPRALEILSAKKGGAYIVLQADPSYSSTHLESRREHGVELQQEPNRSTIDEELFQRPVGRVTIPRSAVGDLQLATIVAKHTPSNAVCIAFEGQAIGVGGGQQARIHATRYACDKADLWRLQMHPRAREVTAASNGRTGGTPLGGRAAAESTHRRGASRLAVRILKCGHELGRLYPVSG